MALLLLLLLGQAGLAYLAVRGANERDAARRERETARVERDQARQERESAEQWAKRQVWATGFYLRDKLNAEHDLEVERERCGSY